MFWDEIDSILHNPSIGTKKKNKIGPKLKKTTARKLPDLKKIHFFLKL